MNQSCPRTDTDAQISRQLHKKRYYNCIPYVQKVMQKHGIYTKDEKIAKDENCI